MTKTGGGWQFLRDYTVIYVCLEGETERVIKCKSKKEHLVHKGFRICKFTEQLLIIGSMDGLRASENSIQIHVWFLHVNIHISEASVHNFHQDKKKKCVPWPGDSVGWNVMKKLHVWSSVGACMGGIPIDVSLSHWCLSLCLSQVNKHILGWGF